MLMSEDVIGDIEYFRLLDEFTEEELVSFENGLNAYRLQQHKLFLINAVIPLVRKEGYLSKTLANRLKKKIIEYEYKMQIFSFYVKERKCYSCKDDIAFFNTIDEEKNRKKNTVHLYKLWQNPIIEFYCCRCLEIEEKKRDLIKNE